MDIYEQLPILLDLEKQKDSIILRLDKIGLGNFLAEENSVQEIILTDCILTKKLLNEIKGFVNQIFEYEFFQQDNKIIFQFWADYGRLEGEIECKDINETFSNYTKQDLIKKGSALFDLYVDLHKRFSENEAINFQLRKKLDFEIANEIERSQRKVEFFENKEKSKSETFQSEIKFLQKLQKIL